MATTDPELVKAAQLAYERSNVSLSDYNPNELPEDKKLSGEVEREAPLEPVLTTADSGVSADAAAADTSSSSSSKTSSK